MFAAVCHGFPFRPRFPTLSSPRAGHRRAKMREAVSPAHIVHSAATTREMGPLREERDHRKLNTEADQRKIPV